MRIEKLIESIRALPTSWVRLEQVRMLPGVLELTFGIHVENRGRKKIDGWRVTCRDIRETHLTDFNGGGVGIYPATHPAARQYVTRPAELRWLGDGDKSETIGKLLQAHTDAVDDWIPFDRYISIKSISGKTCVCRGPDFLMRAYAKALRGGNRNPRLTMRASRQPKPERLKVLHFGASYVVAAAFTVHHC